MMRLLSSPAHKQGKLPCAEKIPFYVREFFAIVEEQK
jgi:hypothetical protein